METQTILGYDMASFITIALVLVLTIAFALLIYGQSFNVFGKKRLKSESDSKATASLLAALKRHTRLKDFTLLEKTNLTFNGKTYSFDAIIIGYFGCLAIKSVDKNGDIYAEYAAENWVQIIDNKRIEFKSPVIENAGSIKFLKDIFKEEKVKSGLVDSTVVLSGKGVNPILHKTISYNTIKTLLSALTTDKYTGDNGVEVKLMEEAILKYKV